MKRIINLLLPCLLLTSLATISFRAQGPNATLQGTVQDEQGGIVSGATVTISDLAKGLNRTAVTNADGYFTVPFLPASSYTITVERQGFAKIQINNYVLNVGDQKNISIQLKVGAPDAPIVNVDASDVIEARTDG